MLKSLDCVGCSLYEKGNSFSIPDGQGTLGVVGIGEALGSGEAKDGKPFRPHAQAGSLLEQVFRVLGIKRDQFLLWNLCACQPPDNRLAYTPWEQSAIAHCQVHFQRVVGSFNPPHRTKTLVAFGNLPMAVLTGYSGSASEKQSITSLRGFVMQSPWGPCVPTYHPAFLQRGKHDLIPTVAEDIRRAVDVASGKFTDYPGHPDYQKRRYQVAPGIDEAWGFYYRCKDCEQLPIANDIETPLSRHTEEDERDEIPDNDPIILMQFSLGKGEGIAMPFRGEYIEIIGRILALANVKLGHNWWEFDRPRIRNANLIVNGRVHDTMWMFKHYHPRLQRALQSVASFFGFPFAWKHLMDTALEWYGCADVDSLHYIVPPLVRQMKARGVWQGYLDQVFRISPIMIGAQDRGIPVNETKRQELKVTFRERRKGILTELEKLVPLDIRKLAPKRKVGDKGHSYGYKRTPKQVIACALEYKTIQKEFADGLHPGKKLVSFRRYVYKSAGLIYREFPDWDEEGNEVRIGRWARIEEFKASRDQIIRYIKWKKQQLLRDPAGEELQ